MTPVIVWRNPRIVTGARLQAAAPGPPTRPRRAPRAAGARRPDPLDAPLRAVLPADAAASLKFGTSLDGSTDRARRLRDERHRLVHDPAAAAGTVAELQVDAELGSDRNAVIRVMISDRPEGSARDASQRAFLGDPSSAGYKTFRAGIAEYVALLPPNSHGEAEPRRQGSGAAAVRQHLQQPRARRVRAEGQVPAQRSVLHQQHRRRRRSRAARPGMERSVRVVAVSRCLSRHADRPLRPDADEPPSSPS